MHDLASHILERSDAGARCDVVELVFGCMYTANAHDASTNRFIDICVVRGTFCVVSEGSLDGIYVVRSHP
jgi:hypothetical protein